MAVEYDYSSSLQVALSKWQLLMLISASMVPHVEGRGGAKPARKHKTKKSAAEKANVEPSSKAPIEPLTDGKKMSKEERKARKKARRLTAKQNAGSEVDGINGVP